MTATTNILLDVSDLRTVFVAAGESATVVDGVSFQIPRGTTTALLGESGCGKTTTVSSILKLLRSPPGQIVAGQAIFRPRSDSEGSDLISFTDDQIRAVRGQGIALVPQDPGACLNPAYTIGEQMVEVVRLCRGETGAVARTIAAEMLDHVGIATPLRRMLEYPHELSVGLQQRVVIAQALVCEPSLLIADEPTSALDVRSEWQVLELLLALRAEMGMSLLVITHDLGVAQAADFVYVMYAGQIVERGPARAVFACPRHPYTQALFRASPSVNTEKTHLDPIPGVAPDPTDYPPACRFHPRCALTEDLARSTAHSTTIVKRCGQDVHILSSCRNGPRSEGRSPALEEIVQDHYAACWEICRE